MSPPERRTSMRGGRGASRASQRDLSASGGPNAGANPGWRELGDRGRSPAVGQTQGRILVCENVLLEVCVGLCPQLHGGGPPRLIALPNAHSLCLMSPTCVCTGTAAGKGRRQVVGRGWDVRRSVLEGAKIGEWFHSADRPSSFKHHLAFPT